MIAVTFAVPHESRAFRTLLRGARTVTADGSQSWRGDLSGNAVSVWHTGVGAASAAAAARRVVRFARPSFVIAAGYGGGLHQGLHVGDVVVDRRGAHGYVPLPSGCVEGVIASHSGVLESPEQKAAFARATGAAAVDMESAAIGAICAEAGVPLVAVRAISDAAGDSLPVPMEHWFDLRKQRARPFSMAAYLARHPGRICAFVHFMRQLGPARAALARAIAQLVDALAPTAPVS